MDTEAHADRVRRSFERQQKLFTGPDSPFAGKGAGAHSWLGPLARDMRALDVACGAAHLSGEIAAQLREVVAVDLTPSLLQLAAARLRDAGVANVRLEQADAQALPFAEGSFDLVFCRSALHHFADPAGVVAEMLRVCQPGGRVALSDLVAPSARVREAFDRVHRWIDPSHCRAFLEAELALLLPGSCALEQRGSVEVRMPLDVALTDQSDRGAVLGALRAELGGGDPTGFEPCDEDGKLCVAFRSCFFRGVRGQVR